MIQSSKHTFLRHQRAHFFSLGVGNSVTITLTLDIPINEFTRLIVGIADFEGYYIDQTFSEWFDT